MGDFLWNAMSFVVALGLLITAHEYGHFYVARRCGVKVERFSIGFGKAIWRKIGKDGTEYVIAAIPLGGYVKMLDERVETVPEHLVDQAFNRKSVWQRIAIVSAGPIANFLFAIVALYVMFLIGVPALKPVITGVDTNKPAAVIAVTSPQQIVAIAGQDVNSWQDINLALVGQIGSDQIDVAIAPLASATTAQIRQTYQLDTRQWQFDPEKESAISAIGFVGYRPQILPIIAQFTDDSAAELAGLKLGDEIIAVNGAPYANWTALVELIQHSVDQSIDFTVKRDGEQFHINVLPKVKDVQGKMIGLIGIVPTSEAVPDNMRIEQKYGIVDAVGVALDKTWQLTSVSVKMIGKLLTGDVSVKNLSGPISIAQGAGNSAQYGLVHFLGFLALISVSLGIMNLLPLPVLDGGHLMYYLVELVTGRPVSERVQEIGFRFGAAMLFVLMSVALFNDFARL
ncbi:sigma E protease regulator RseP [Shewanella sp. NIFS-20-20]|uniref:sigma E protease regulator RseP n=1 Tax=Shewanella sp. NIFS-20-20 TaxID=2853806 RepID=UPI001C471039|nr:sigma E protease regulator RseP [Shewanella sp. NIFS-20-20]MBV7316252.1 sigma E protease regulator RseP [Shewanella sp. NIFS-20-20]